MLKKKRFDVGLFCEAFRQIRMPGILFTVIFTLEAILIPLSTVIERMNSDFYQTHQVGAQSVTGYSEHPILLAAVYLAAPLLMLNLFGFLRSRSASDVYHAVPQTRLCLYVSFFSAGALWLLLMIGGSTLASCCMHAAFPELFSVVWGSVIAYVLNMLAASLLTAAVTALAASVTGTLFNAVLVASVILLLPRFVLLVFTGVISSELPMVAYRTLPFLLTYRCNIPAGLLLSVVSIVMPYSYGRFNSTELMTDPRAMLYTLVVALLYATAGAVLFVRRKSESAEHASPSRRMQSVYRILVTMSFCVGICALLFCDRNNLRGSWFGYLVLYILAVVIYFLYELLTTKKWVNLLRALPGLGMVALLNAVCLLGMWGLYQSELHYAPDAEEIQQISVVPEEATYGSLRFDEYVMTQIDRVELEDPAIRKLVADSLRQDIEDFCAGEYSYDVRSMALNIRTKWGVRTRVVTFQDADYQKIEQVLYAGESYSALRKTLPDMLRSSGYLQSEAGQPVELEDGGAALYALLCEEIAAISDTEWLYYNWSQRGQPVFSFNTVLGDGSVEISVPLDELICPRSCAWARSYLQQKQKDVVDMARESLSRLTAEEELYVELSFPAEDTWFYFHSANYTEKEQEELVAYILAHMTEQPLSESGGRVYLDIAGMAYEPISLDDTARAALPEFLHSIEK